MKWPRATNFDMRITREQAIALLSCGLETTPFWVLMSKEYGAHDAMDGEWTGLTSEDLETIQDDKSYKTFELWFDRTQCEKLMLEEVNT